MIHLRACYGRYNRAWYALDNDLYNTEGHRVLEQSFGSIRLCLIPVEKRSSGAVQLHIKNYRDFVEDVIAGGCDHANFRSEAATIFLSTQPCKRAPFSCGLRALSGLSHCHHREAEAWRF